MGDQTRSAPYLSWHPDGGRKLCVSYSILDFQKQPADMPLSSYVWDVNNPNTPEIEMTPASQMVCSHLPKLSPPPTKPQPAVQSHLKNLQRLRSDSQSLLWDTYVQAVLAQSFTH
jgi:hypothetical protein